MCVEAEAISERAKGASMKMRLPNRLYVLHGWISTWQVAFSEKCQIGLWSVFQWLCGP